MLSNTYLTTVHTGSFSKQSQGLEQGFLEDDPALRYQITSGKLLTSPLSMWGGVAISESLTTSLNGGSNLGLGVSRATAVAGISGFCVFDQAHSMLLDGVDDVPQACSGDTINYVRIGSRTRLAVACSDALQSLAGANPRSVQVTWDFQQNMLVPYVAHPVNVATTKVTTAANASSPTGFTATVTTAAAHGLSAGDVITLSGITPADYNGGHVVAVPSATTLSFPVASLLATATTQGTVTASGGAFLSSVNIIDIQVGNSKTVAIDPITNVMSWNPTGSCALIEI